MTALGERLAEEIRRDGPIGIDRFMAAALGDPRDGYYMTRDPLGAAGDFVTAPEISQVFGEILGAWLAQGWIAMGAPDPCLLVECGPGRGTLAADILRALRVVPACRAAMRLHLVETSPALRARQQATLAERHPDAAPQWHGDLCDLPPGPLLLVANEFLDALPIRQWRRSGGTWRERRVGLAGEALAFVDGPAGVPEVAPPDEAAEGAIFETCAPAQAFGRALGRRLAAAPGRALLVDYGHGASGLGETLQAVRGHRPAPVLAEPGLADLTAHVDFAALAHAIAEGGGASWGPVGQGRFLIENGAVLRAEALARGKPAEAAAAIRGGVRRLVGPAAMGRLFKVMAAVPPGTPRPPGF